MDPKSNTGVRSEETMGESNSVTFFCRACDLERDYYAVKRYLSHNWGPNEVPYWQAKCECGRILWRHIIDKYRDPYVHYSPSLRQYRAEHWRDLVQPGDPQFRTFYTNTQKEIEEAEEKSFLKEKNNKEQRDKMLRAIPKDHRLQETVAKLYE